MVAESEIKEMLKEEFLTDIAIVLLIFSVIAIGYCLWTLYTLWRR